MASAALALGIVIGASGCSMITYQATTEHYDASDGVSVNVGDLDLRNVLVVSDDGEQGNLVMTVVNRGDEDASLNVEFADGKTTAEPIEIGAGSTVAFGVDDVEGIDVLEPVLLDGIDSIPGSLMPIYFHYSGAEGQEINVPVLDGTLAEYKSLVP
ncbi:hypothetical protein ROT00_14330 [Agromyces mediolanus]|uniref:hypothetical protein n=1 Tax=Agromyces mediolanus TaxID=41986 RepID=UPI003839AAF7